MTDREALQYGRLMLSLEEDKESAMYNFIAKAIKALEQTRWIPVSERLPDIHNYCMKYLVTDCHRHIHTSLFTESGGKGWWSHSDVVAWLPLPEPYKASQTGAEGGEE